MFLYTKKITSEVGKDLFKEYEVSDKDIEKYLKLIEAGKEQEAIDLFIEEYIIAAIEVYTNKMDKYVTAGTTGEIDKKNSFILYSSIIAVSLAFKKNIKDNVSTFANIYSKNVFSQEKLTNVQMKNAILETTIKRFNELTENAMSQTQAAVLGQIRDAQRAFIQANQTIRINKLTGEELDIFTKDFKNKIERSVPGLRSFADRGFLLNSKGRQYSFDYYFDMSTRTTLLNVERHTVEYLSETNQDEILIYYLSDKRHIKTKPREICKAVLANKIKGYSFVALTDRAAQALGILTLTQVKEKGGLGPWCRHNIKRVDKKLQDEILNRTVEDVAS